VVSYQVGLQLGHLAQSDQLSRQREASEVVALRAPMHQIRHAVPRRAIRPGAGLAVTCLDWRYFLPFFPPLPFFLSFFALIWMSTVASAFSPLGSCARYVKLSAPLAFLLGL
jgi:hypothetical protein